MRRAWYVIAALFTLPSCGSDSSGPSAVTYASIAGTYNGGIIGTTQGVALNGVFSLTLTQNQGNLSGSFSLAGRLNDGVSFVDVLGTGSASGTIASGNNPSVNVTVRSGSCTNYTSSFSGAYDVANSRITLTGNVDMLRNDCTVALRYPTTFILTR
jgi:hypothetical protein